MGEIMSCKLFVGNLSYEVDQRDLEEAFCKYRVNDAIIISDRETQRPRGFGFVTMDTPEEADKAISEMSGFELKGRAMTVNQATERPPRDRGGRDGGFRSGGGYQRRDNNRGYQQRGGYQGGRDRGYNNRGGDRYGDDNRGQRQERDSEGGNNR